MDKESPLASVSACCFSAGLPSSWTPSDLHYFNRFSPLPALFSPRRKMKRDGIRAHGLLQLLLARCRTGVLWSSPRSDTRFEVIVVYFALGVLKLVPVRRQRLRFSLESLDIGLESHRLDLALCMLKANTGGERLHSLSSHAFRRRQNAKTCKEWSDELPVLRDISRQQDIGSLARTLVHVRPMYPTHDRVTALRNVTLRSRANMAVRAFIFAMREESLPLRTAIFLVWPMKQC
jgi:hypothetical protein